METKELIVEHPGVEDVQVYPISEKRENTFCSMEFEVGMTVIWLGSSYTIIEMKKNGAVLKQNFSIGTVLTSTVPYIELTLVE